ncbi:class I SAM-dependent methyltransferase [Brevibacillus fulvus]|uniref:tRNA (Cmo5U34)-methyltransferase n=1 Tax=Brevibacillus fulvus TaxID=1125967 RepID=A0A938XZ54_9BACL|nr:class I SAM-dependent methyltransferase [Brevibacillus fulvus]MBM7590293.1 tRNA (cmo5U34)-methyltransferase [Brevibacillus fulvus]
MTTEQNIIKSFDRVADQYDKQRRKLIPCFDDFYQIAVSLADTPKQQPRILDLGAGTGLLSAFLLERYPQAAVTLVDLSEKMLDVARERFRQRPQITFLHADYLTYEFSSSYDLIVSGLSIHHLPDPDKQRLYQKVFALLDPGGIFINADQVLGHTAYLEFLYKNDWRHKVESSGLSQEEIAAAYERTKLDQMATLEEQLRWLNHCGFSDVDCVYKYYNFAVMFARKNKG